MGRRLRKEPGESERGWASGQCPEGTVAGPLAAALLLLLADEVGDGAGDAAY